MGLMTHPCHPGEILKHEFLEPLGLSAIGLAQAIGVPRTRIERLVKGQTRVTPDTALRFARALGTTADFWINMQTNFDLAAAERHVDLSGIEPLFAT